jgi:hypothetical protein
MSKGWESKSVEEQQAQQVDVTAVKQVDSHTGALDEANRNRQRQALELQRERILSERTSSPHRRSALANALAQIEEKLTELGWVMHL